MLNITKGVVKEIPRFLYSLVEKRFRNVSVNFNTKESNQ